MWNPFRRNTKKNSAQPPKPRSFDSYSKLSEAGPRDGLTVSSDELLSHPEDKRVLGDDKFMQRVRSDYTPRVMRPLEDLMSAMREIRRAARGVAVGQQGADDLRRLEHGWRMKQSPIA